MRFYDEALITVESGKWWDGTVTGRREAWVAFGWPSGGNGGQWWSIVLQASKDENTLVAYKFKKNFRAKPGEAGKSKDQYGSNADDLTLVVPVWTLVRNNVTGDVLYVFSQDKEEFVIVKWWAGGEWNIHFKDAVNQFPNFCLLGEPWHKLEILLELQLLADVALIGTPSVGKSSIINAISHTKAKVAEYPFTTLVPNLWSVVRKKKTFNVIDIPGLIKWSAQGKWLGNAFLRHVLKARVFAIVVDIARYDTWILEVNDLLSEIFSYVEQKFAVNPKDMGIKKDGKYLLFYAEKDGEILLEKRMLFVINKYDLIWDVEILGEYQDQLFDDILKFLRSKKSLWKITKATLKDNSVTVSAVTRYGLDDFLDKVIDVFHGLKTSDVYHVRDEVREEHEEEEISSDMIVDVTEQDKQFLIENNYMDEKLLKHIKIRRIRNAEICKLVWMLPWWNPEAENWFWKMMQTEGYLEIFDSAGIRKWDILKIVSYYAWKDDRYILY